MARQRPWLKVMSMVAAVAVAVMVVSMSPVSAAFTPNKKTIKKIARKIAKKVATQQINAMVPGIVQSQAYTKPEADSRFAKHFYRRSAPVAIPDSGFAFGEVACPAGTEATGGGVFTSGPNIFVHGSMPTDGTGTWTTSFGGTGAGFTGWGGIGTDQLGGGGSITLWVICQDAQSIDSNYVSGSTAYRPDGDSATGWSASP